MPIINFFTSNTNGCSCNNGNRTIILNSPKTTNVTQVERIAQFKSVGSTVIQSGEIIPLNLTQFNNISQSVVLTNQGTISLLEQGVYLIQYNVVVSNLNTVPVDVIVSLVKNSNPIVTLSSSVSTVEADATITISNSIINSVVSGSTQELQLINSSTDELNIISANVVISKIT